MSDAARRYALGVLASGIVHAVVVLGMPRPERAPERTPAQPLWLELHVEQREQPAARTAEEPLPPAPGVEPEAREAQHPPSSRRARSTDRRHTEESPVQAPPVEVAAESSATAGTSATATEPQQSASSGQQTPTLDLSPLSAARTIGDSTYFPLRDAGVPHRAEPPLSHTAQANALAQQVPGLRASKGAGRSIEGAITDAAEDAIYNVLRPWKLFRRTMRGSQYRYTGGGFDAAILPDGRVRFRDKDGLHLTVMVTQPRESGPSAQSEPTATFGLSLGDPRSLWHRIRGKDPFAAERRVFLERTRALREYLAGRATERGLPAEEEDSEDDDLAEPKLEPPAPPH